MNKAREYLDLYLLRAELRPYIQKLEEALEERGRKLRELRELQDRNRNMEKIIVGADDRRTLFVRKGMEK